MLSLSRKTDYALIALSLLAKQETGVVSAREIAAGTGLPLPILTNILKSLAHAEIVVSERGACGGYGLGRSPETVTLYDLITAIEGRFQLVRCAVLGKDSDDAPCELEPSCPTRLPAHKVHARLRRFLESITLAELVDSSMEPGEMSLSETESRGMPRTAVKERTR
jgi:Rrf2 family protein